MKVSYSCTFEFDVRPTITHRGVVEGGKAHVCMGSATKAAFKAMKPKGWRSVVCVLLERLDTPKEDE